MYDFNTQIIAEMTHRQQEELRRQKERNALHMIIREAMLDRREKRKRK